MLNEQEIVSLVVDRFNYSQACKESKDEEVTRYIKMYDSVIGEDFPHKTKMFIPYSYMVVESIIPRVMASIFNSRPILRAKPRPESKGINTDAITHLLDYAFDNDNFFDKIEILLRNTLIFGNGIIKYKWLFDVDETIYKAEELLTLDNFNNIKEGIIEDRPATEVISYWDYFPDPDITQEYKIHRIVTTLGNLKERNKIFKIYKNLEKISEGYSSSNFFSDVRRYDSITGKLTTDNSAVSGYDAHKEYIELLEYWDKDNLYVVANRSVVIRADKNPFKKMPFIESYAVPRQDSIWGDSLLKPLEKMQHYLNGLKSMKYDLLSQNLQPMWLTTIDSGIEGNILKWKPGKIIKVLNANGLAPMRPNVAGLQDSYLEEQMLTTIMQRVSGITDYLIGVQSKNVNETATGVSLLTEASQSRVKLFIQRFGNSALRELGYKFIELYNIFADGDIHYRVFNQSKEDTMGTIGKDEIMGRYELQLVESMFYSAQLRQQQIQMLFGALYGKQEVNNYELVETLLDAFELKNSKDVLVSKEEYEQKQIELIEKAMEQMQQKQAEQQGEVYAQQ